MKAFTNALACPALALLTGICAAQEPPAQQVTVNIEAQPMVDALNGWAQQTGLQLIVPDGEVANKLAAPSVKGVFTARQALTELLEGTPLTYEFVNERTVVIRERHASTSGDRRSSAKLLRLAETQEAAPKRASAGSVASAAEDGRAARDLEVVVVTAQKRVEQIQDVPISISVLGGRDLDRSTDEGVTQALARVPGVATSVSLQGGGTRIAVRGVTSGGSLFGGSSPVSYYLDSVPFGLVKTPIGPDSNAYDLDRVEVLRGPQGTLYGANAQAGVARVLTNDADLDEFQLKGRASASSTEGGGENFRGDMAVNVPIIQDKLAVRAVVGYQDLSGWIDTPLRRNANDAEIGTFRLKVNAQPTDNLSIGLSAWLSRSDYGAPPAGDDNGRNPSLVDLSMSTDYDAFGLKIGYEFEPFTLSSQTSYLDYSNSGNVDTTPGTAPASTVLVFTGIDADVLSQEFLLNSNSDGPWRWSLGTSYRDASDRLRQLIAPAGTRFDWTNGSESYAAFGELSRRFFDDKFQWTLGARYFHDDVQVDEHFVPPGQVLQHEDESFDSTTPRAVLTWYPSDDVTVYASYSEGFRSGFAQNPIVTRSFPGFPAVDPDKLKNYEIGAKTQLFDRRLSLESSVYYMDWVDVQQTLRVLFGTTGITAALNGQSASGMGFDFSALAEPLDGLQLGVTFSWNDLSMDGQVLSGGVVLFQPGDRLNLSSEYTAGVSADYVFAPGPAALEWRVSLASNYTSEQLNRTIAGGLQRIGVGDSMLISRASLSVHGDGKWAATLFVDNISNEDGSPVRDPIRTPGNDERVRPRSIGLQLEYRY